MSRADELLAVQAAGAVGPITLRGLHGAIVDRMEEIAAVFWGSPTKTATRSPIVRDGWLPPKSGNYEAGEEFPFFIVRPSSGTDSIDGRNPTATAGFDLILGAYEDEDDGWMQLLDWIEAIRQAFEREPWIGGAFEHLGPLNWTIPEEQTRPQWAAIVRTTFSLPRPRRIEERNPTEV